MDEGDEGEAQIEWKILEYCTRICLEVLGTVVEYYVLVG